MSRAHIHLLIVGLAMSGSAAFAQESPPPGSPAQSAASESKDAVESLPEISLQELLDEVAANSGKKFLVDSRVQNRLSVGGTPLENPTCPILLSVLRNNGLVAVEIEDRVNIVPDAISRQLPAPLAQRDDPSIPDDEWVSRVLTVKNVPATHLVPILRPLVPQEGHLAAVSETKLLIVDRYANVRRLTEIVEALSQ